MRIHTWNAINIQIEKFYLHLFRIYLLGRADIELSQAHLVIEITAFYIPSSYNTNICKSNKLVSID